MKARHEFQSDKEYNDYLLVYFAGLFMQAIVSRSSASDRPDMPHASAVEYADALLAELEKNSTEMKHETFLAAVFADAYQCSPAMARRLFIPPFLDYCEERGIEIDNMTESEVSKEVDHYTDYRNEQSCINPPLYP